MLLFAVVSMALLVRAPAPACPPGGLPEGQTPGAGPSRTVLAQFGAQHGPSDEEKERARKRIGITKDQQDQIEALFKDSEQRMRELRGKMRDLYTELYENIYGEYDLDRARAADVRKQILDLHRKMGDIHAENEVKLRKILNRDQFERMRALMKEERAKHPRGGRDRRPGPPP